VGSGGVGKTTLAAALGLHAAGRGEDALVMTFDPSRRLKDALGVGEAAADRPVRVAASAPGRLDASLLDARATFDRLVERHSPDRAAAARILRNRFYDQLAGSLAGILEYMAVERLFETAAEGRYGQVVLDTPPTRQALDFLEAPDRITAFLDSGALKMGLRPWFDERGRLRAARSRLVGAGLSRLLDRLIGLSLLRDIAEFFQAFGPLYGGFRERAAEVRALLRAEQTRFLLVAGPGEERLADTLFFARRLTDAGHRLAAVVVNQVHPVVRPARAVPGPWAAGLDLLAAAGARDRDALATLRQRLREVPVAAMPLLPAPPTGLDALAALGDRLAAALADAG
jgi:anion-transporting  ArsA/GET3 family ATPase